MNRYYVQPDLDVPFSAHLTIGKIASLAKVSADTLRYYERERLIAPTAKSPGGYRLYERDALRRIRFIKQAQRCGFNLSEIRSLLALRGNNAACCRDVRRVALEKKLQLEAKVKAMKVMSKALTRLIKECSAENRPLDDCAILAALESANGIKRSNR
jgi:MerR family Zn(II)-responsive transcriptional regulator of zntA